LLTELLSLALVEAPHQRGPGRIERLDAVAPVNTLNIDRCPRPAARCPTPC
jgi:hypothetical protein